MFSVLLLFQLVQGTITWVETLLQHTNLLFQLVQGTITWVESLLQHTNLITINSQITAHFRHHHIHHQAVHGEAPSIAKPLYQDPVELLRVVRVHRILVTLLSTASIPTHQEAVLRALITIKEAAL